NSNSKPPPLASAGAGTWVADCRRRLDQESGAERGGRPPPGTPGSGFGNRWRPGWALGGIDDVCEPTPASNRSPGRGTGTEPGELAWLCWVDRGQTDGRDRGRAPVPLQRCLRHAQRYGTDSGLVRQPTAASPQPRRQPPP